MILVTGGTGLVGAHLLYQLSLKNDRIIATRRKNSKLQYVQELFGYFTENPENLFKKIHWVEADITDIYSLEQAFEDVTHVYHAAALVSFNPKDYRAMRKINIEGTSNVVNLCVDKKVEKLCFVSSVAAVGKSVKTPTIDETCEWSVDTSNYGYAITKYGAEMEVWRASQEGVDIVIVNPGVILGAGFWKHGSSIFFSKIDKGLKFFTNGITGFVSVKDVVQSMLLLMESNIKNERYILVSENLPFKTVFDEISDGLGKKRPTIKVSRILSEIAWRIEKIRSLFTGKSPLLTKQSAKSIHNKHFYTSEKIKTELNYEFETISACIKRICTLYKKR